MNDESKNGNNGPSMEKIISLAKRRGFVYQGSEIYGGLAGTWDYGPLGVTLKNNIKNLWWKMFVEDREDMYGVDAAILMNSRVWEASGHVDTFTDPLVECKKCKKRYREDNLDKKHNSAEDAALCWVCENCGQKNFESDTPVRNFNMMFKTQIGAAEDSSAAAYLRPETAQGMFVNFKNVVDSFHPKLPFGLAQIGKAFRNEITPRDFIFRVRELEQMEIEYFVTEADWENRFTYWHEQMKNWMNVIGLSVADVHELEVAAEDRAHYSKRTIDFEFDFPFGRKELYGLAYRTDFDLKNHQEASGVEQGYLDSESNERFIPHVIEPTFGVERTMLALLVSAYTEDELGGETRTYLKFKPSVAPVKAAIFPLLKNKPELVAKAREAFSALKKEIPQILWDDNGNIGKRYRRQDEIGTPYCITIDFDTLGVEKPEFKDTVTLRDRDTGTQERIAISELVGLLRQKISE